MKRAIVVGGGIAGLASAKVLSSHFDQVTLYDSGLPAQSHHLHVLLKKGQEILEELFPGILKKLIAADSPEIDWAKDTLWINRNKSFPQYESTVKARSFSRSLLQKLMNDELTGIEIVNERVTDLSLLRSDLIVVATGHQGNEVKTKISLSYQTLIFKSQDIFLGNHKQMYVQLDPPYSKIGGVISPIENGKTIVTIIEKEERFSRTNFFEKAKLVSPEFYQAIQNATPISDVKYFRKTHTAKSKIDNKPGMIFIGDVNTSLNPVFGQGMTLALMQARELKEMLEKKNFHHTTYTDKCMKLRRTPVFLSEAGSQEKGFLKFGLRTYLAICACSIFFHHNFLKKLHSLRLI